jgi:hypothetical protein
VKTYGQKCHYSTGEEHRLRVFENRVLARISGPKRDKSGRRLKETA